MIIEIAGIEGSPLLETVIVESLDKATSQLYDDLIMECCLQDEIGNDADYALFIETANPFLVRDGILHEGSTFILDAESKLKKATSLEARKLAKEANDADYKRYVKACFLKKKYGARIDQKFGVRATANVRKKRQEIIKSSRTQSLVKTFRTNVVDKKK